jgi:hypothetical protein
MHEHGGENGWHLTGGIGDESTWDEGPLFNEGIAAVQLNEEDQDVQCNQGVGHDRQSPARAIVVTNWKHERSSSSGVSRL